MLFNIFFNEILQWIYFLNFLTLEVFIIIEGEMKATPLGDIFIGLTLFQSRKFALAKIAQQFQCVIIIFFDYKDRRATFTS